MAFTQLTKEEGKERIKEALEDAPEEVMECLNAALGPQTVQKFQTGKMMPRRDFGDLMRQCFEETMEKEMMERMGADEENGLPEGMEGMEEMMGGSEQMREQMMEGETPPEDQEEMMENIEEQMRQELEQQMMEQMTPSDDFETDLIEEEPQSFNNYNFGESLLGLLIKLLTGHSI